MSVAVWHLYGQIWLYEDCPPGSDDLALRSHHIGIQTLSTSLWLGARGNSSVMTRLQSFCCCLSQTDGSLHIVYREGGGHRTVPGWKTKLYCCSPRESGWLVSTVKTFIQPQNKNNYRDTQIVKIVAYPSQFDMFTLSAVFIGKARSHF